MRSSASARAEQSGAAYTEGAAGEPTDAGTAPTTPVPRAVDIDSCVATAAYEFESETPATLKQVYVVPDLGPGGPVVAVTGNPGPATGGETRRQLLPERDPMGKVLITDDRSGEVLTSIDSKRATSDELLMVAEHVLDGEELHGRFMVVNAPAERNTVSVLGTSCQIGDTFYGVEVLEGGLFERSVYMLSIDPLRSEEVDGTTVAVFGPADQSVPVRTLSDDEWRRMQESTDSSMDGSE